MRTPMSRIRFETRPHCEICGRMRSAGGHDKCSKIRQQRSQNTDTLREQTTGVTR